MAQCFTSAQLTLARYAVNGAWPAAMRIQMLPAYLDFRSGRELVLAVSRGEALTSHPVSRSMSGQGSSVKVIVDEHVACGIRIWQNPTKPTW
jgi:hypothetical protein